MIIKEKDDFFMDEGQYDNWFNKNYEILLENSKDIC